MAAHRLLDEFLLAQSLVFRELTELKRRGSANRDGDEYFRQQHERADNANEQGQRSLFNKLQNLGDEMDAATGAFLLHGQSPQMLDLCMAPGGYTASLLKRCRFARVSGITLPVEAGGHPLLIRTQPKDNRVEVVELDITMLSSEFGVEEIPDDHPDAVEFLPGQHPYQDKSFDLVICDGQVLRTHIRADHRERSEPLRLSRSQLILALQRIRSGGTLIMLLHKVDGWNNFRLLSQFSDFAHVELFKPRNKHNQKSSFYLVATNVDPQHPTARNAVTAWKREWKQATFAWNPEQEQSAKAGALSTDADGNDAASDQPPEEEKGPEEEKEEASRLLTDFGPTFIRLAEPIWAIQRDGLSKAPYILSSTHASVSATDQNSPTSQPAQC